MSISLNQLPQHNKPQHNKPRPVSNTGPAQQPPKSGLAGLLTKELTLGKPSYSDKKKERFFAEMSMLLEAGVDLRTALEINLQEQLKDKDHGLVQGIYNKLVQGQSLSQAIEQSGLFGVYEVYSLKVGEETGQLTTVLQQLADYYKSRLAFKRKLVNALSYPTVVLCTAIMVMAFMLNFVIPMFADIFRQSNVPLPGITQTVISASNFFQHYFVFLLLVVVGMVVAYYYFRSSEGFRRIASLSLLRVKYLGDIIRLNYLYQFCKTIALLTGSGLPLLQSIQLLRKMIVYYPMEQDLAHVEEELMKGKSLHESMEGTRLFDRKLISLTRLGEEVNRQGMVYSRMANQYEQELQQKTELLSSILEPLIILLVGVFVAIILISMYLPMFKLSGAVA